MLEWDSPFEAWEWRVKESAPWRILREQNSGLTD